MTVLPTATPLQTVSLAPTSHQINVPLGSGGTRAITAGKLISVTGAGTGPSGPGPNNPPPGVTIQKSTIPVSSPSPRTISLPYGAPTPVATGVATLPKPVSQAIPVARVCPQPNVVTITTTVGNVISSGEF